MLFEKVFNALSGMVASYEREQIIAHMKEAYRLNVDDEITINITDVIRFNPVSIVRNLDRVKMEHPVMWIEYNHAPRCDAVGDGYNLKLVERVGVLLMTQPETPDHIFSFLAWETTGKRIFFSYAIMSWAFNELNSLLKADVTPENVEELLMDKTHITIPEGLQKEMAEWQEIKIESKKFSQASKHTMREILGENMFLICLLMLINSRSTKIKKTTDIDQLVSRIVYGKQIGFNKSWLGFKFTGLEKNIRDAVIGQVQALQGNEKSLIDKRIDKAVANASSSE